MPYKKFTKEIIEKKLKEELFSLQKTYPDLYDIILRIYFLKKELEKHKYESLISNEIPIFFEKMVDFFEINISKNKKQKKQEFNMEFKKECCDIVINNGESVYKVSKNMGISRETLRKWLKSLTDYYKPKITKLG